MKKRKEEKMVMISFHLPESMLVVLDELVRRGVYPNRAEAVREALRELLRNYRDYITSVGTNTHVG